MGDLGLMNSFNAGATSASVRSFLTEKPSDQVNAMAVVPVFDGL